MAQTCISRAHIHSESLAVTSTGRTVQQYLEHLHLHSAASHIDRNLELKLLEKLLQQNVQKQYNKSVVIIIESCSGLNK